MSVRMAGVAYELGQPRRLAELAEATTRPELVAALGGERAGFKYYLASDASILALAEAAAVETLAATGQAPGEIDTVVFASDSFVVGAEQRQELGRFLRRLGLARAYPINVTLAECASTISAIRVAAALVAQGEARNILLVSVDRAAFATPATRIIGDGVGVASDAAATALITAVPLEGFEIEGAAAATSPELLDPGDDEPRGLRARVEAHQRLFRELLGRRGLRPADVERVFPNNFSRSVLRIFLGECGFRGEQIYFDNISRIGHCLGSDCLINLRDFSEHHEWDGRRPLVLLSAGQAQLGAALVRPTGTALAL